MRRPVYPPRSNRRTVVRSVFLRSLVVWALGSVGLGTVAYVVDGPLLSYLVGPVFIGLMVGVNVFAAGFGRIHSAPPDDEERP